MFSSQVTHSKYLGDVIII